MSNIRVSCQNRELAGSCNACQRRDEATVIVVSLSTLTFRACNKCAAEIAAQMREMAMAYAASSAVPPCSAPPCEATKDGKHRMNLYMVKEQEGIIAFPRCTKCGYEPNSQIERPKPGAQA